MTVSLAIGCGFSSEEGGGGARTLNWYVFNEPGGANEQADQELQRAGRAAATGSSTSACPPTPNQQRELIVRRLAAEDDTVDLVGMDVIWTAEFAEAGWIQPWDGASARPQATDGKLEGPRKTVEYQDKVWAIPFTTNTQLLFYRKDNVDEAARGLHLGRDDRPGREGRTSRSRCRPPSTRATRCGSTP